MAANDPVHVLAVRQQSFVLGAPLGNVVVPNVLAARVVLKISSEKMMSSRQSTRLWLLLSTVPCRRSEDCELPLAAAFMK